ncbi:MULTISPECIES: ATP-binding cassette domain-containing protein [unclassified Gordonia (in: high G+C Gram-positive bacteria)]|uniref:ATP-binding cassette domain-containing protein n=1 Tax=unclassified Gordonia (in: high G+C Gram-positive bacteria) TaxID=2657482 RepID=UPI00196479EE|nr:ATP-binding cassette domain-containing protein [Gordonia sp. BP-119]MBN0983606.1 ATP-binding cassette domain-containing protein [Gordonia sp. BP-94]
MTEASGERPSVASYAPRHRRDDLAEPKAFEDPFVRPDPVMEKLLQWRAETAGPADPPLNGDGTRADRVDADGTISTAAATSESSAPNDSVPLSEDSAAMDRVGGSDPKNGWVLEGAAPSTSVSDSDSAASVSAEVTAPLQAVNSVSLSPVSPSSPTSTARAKDAHPAIEAKNLHKRFKDMVAVEDVSFTVAAGSIVALLGPNGAGKTTTVNMLCTLLKPDGGVATVNGHDVAKEAAQVRRSIMLTGQFAALDEALSGRENLILFGRLLGMSKKQARSRANELLETFGLTDAAGKRVGQYSGGMRRRVDIACGLVTAPKVVFLDEPTTGLDPRSRLEVWSLVKRMRATGIGVLLTTQYLEEADSMADEIVVIDKGRVIAKGSANELKAATGEAYCEVTPSDPAELPRLRECLSDLVGRSVREDAARSVSVPAPHGPQTLSEVIVRTEAANIHLSDIALRRPSLDEVFLALTGPDGSST